MLSARVIPCLDVRDAKVVKGVRFQDLRDAGHPAELARRYEEQGADEIVLLDVTATTEERAHQCATVRSVRAELSIPLTVGGGIREVRDVETLLEAGADRVSLNSAAVLRPELVSEVADRFGCQCTVVSIDAARNNRGGYETLVHSGLLSTGIDAIAWARQAEALGAGEILLTGLHRDGTRLGYDLELLARMSEALGIPLIASGGAADANDLLKAFKAGASAVLAASMFHDGDLTVADAKRYLAAHRVEIRP